MVKSDGVMIGFGGARTRTPFMGPFLVACFAACFASCVPQVQGPPGASAARPTEVVIVFLGDTSFGEEYLGPLAALSGVNILERHGYDHPFANFRELLTSADHVIANLEAPVTTVAESPFRTVKPWVNKERPDRAPAAFARIGIDAVSLGNNHAMDYGREGLVETLDHLARHDIAVFGAGRDGPGAGAPHLAEFALGEGSFKLAVVGGFERWQWYEANLSWYAKNEKAGVHALDANATAEAVKAMKKADPDLFIVAFPHWGTDWEWRSKSELQLAQAFAGAGADLVIGHGAHRLQEVEFVSGKPVVFGLGDFVFNSYGGEWAYDSQGYSLVAALRVRALPHGDRAITLRLYPIVTDSLRTGFQPRFVTAKEFETVLKMLRARPRSAAVEGRASFGEDNFGRWIEIPLAGAHGRQDSRGHF